jgi:hypothetical protein
MYYSSKLGLELAEVACLEKNVSLYLDYQNAYGQRVAFLESFRPGSFVRVRPESTGERDAEVLLLKHCLIDVRTGDQYVSGQVLQQLPGDGVTESRLPELAFTMMECLIPFADVLGIVLDYCLASSLLQAFQWLIDAVHISQSFATWCSVNSRQPSFFLQMDNMYAPPSLTVAPSVPSASVLISAAQSKRACKFPATCLMILSKSRTSLQIYLPNAIFEPLPPTWPRMPEQYLLHSVYQLQQQFRQPYSSGQTRGCKEHILCINDNKRALRTHK